MNAEALPRSGLWARLLRGGITLSPFERFLLECLAQHLPAPMAESLRQEWRELNLIQRSPDWQELRFYRLVGARVDHATLPLLPVRPGEVKLLSLALRPGGAPAPVHVNFWAIDRRFFSLNASRSLHPYRMLPDVAVEGAEHSYRSNLRGAGGQESLGAAEHTVARRRTPGNS